MFYDSKSTSRNWRNKPICLQKDMFKNIHDGVVYHNGTGEITLMSIGRRVATGIVGFKHWRKPGLQVAEPLRKVKYHIEFESKF